MSKQVKAHPGKAIKTTHSKSISLNSSQIQFSVSFYKGAGGIYFHGENIPDNQYISSSSTEKTFTVPQNAGRQVVTVAGSAPKWRKYHG